MDYVSIGSNLHDPLLTIWEIGGGHSVQFDILFIIRLEIVIRNHCTLGSDKFGKLERGQGLTINV